MKKGMKPKLSGPELIEFCRTKESEALRLMDARIDMAESWRSGTDAEWRAMTSGSKFVPRDQRLINAVRDEKIAAHYREESEFYEAIVEALKCV